MLTNISNGDNNTVHILGVCVPVNFTSAEFTLHSRRPNAVMTCSHEQLRGPNC